MNPYAIMWLIVFAVMLIIEACTSMLVCVWFMPTALLCVLLAIFGVPSLWQYILFFSISIALLIAFRKPLGKFIYSRNKDTLTNLDVIIGSEARVEEEIDNFKGVGRVVVGSQSWSARSLDGEIIPCNARVVVRKIEGVKLICEYIK